MKSIVSLSGGMDSTTLLAYLLSLDHEVHCINFFYNSKHNPQELKAIEKISSYYKIPVTKVNLNFIGELFKSNLLSNNEQIPEGHYEQENMSLTVVPGRNSIFTTIAAGFAESIGFDTVVLGQHQGDHSIYPDCRPDFIKSINTTIQLSSDGKVKVDAPFIEMDKADIVKLGLELKVPYELTYTCYNGREKSCGKCGSCVERISSFMKWGEKDPLEYEIEVDWTQNYQTFLEKQKIN